MVQIEIGGQKRTVRFGLRVLGNLLEQFETDIEGLVDVMSNNVFLFVPALIFQGHSYSLKREGKAITFTEDDVFDWVEEVGISSEPILQLLEAYAASFQNLTPDEGQEDESDAKKK